MQVPFRRGDVVQYGTPASRNEKLLEKRAIGIVTGAYFGNLCTNKQHEGLDCTLWCVQWLMLDFPYDRYHSCCMTKLGHIEVPDEPVR